MKKGFFIVYEGIDGSGKTTQAKLLASALADSGRPVLVTREPGGTGLGEELRGILLLHDRPIDPVAESFMYAAARAQHVSERILPALGQGAVVICDRFADSTRAYQGCGKGVSGELLERLNRFACLGVVPDLTILLDLDPGLGLSRLVHPPDRMEREGRDFLQRVRQGYLELAGREPDRYLVLNALLPPEEVFGQVAAAVRKQLLANGH